MSRDGRGFPRAGKAAPRAGRAAPRVGRSAPRNFMRVIDIGLSKLMRSSLVNPTIFLRVTFYIK